MSTDVRNDHAAAAQQASEPVVVGLLAAPGVAEDIAGSLAPELPALLHERVPRVRWRFVVRTEPRAGPAGVDVDLVRLARARMLSEGWDLAICLTELPLRVGRRPVTAYASVALGVGLVSVPALGALDLADRVRDSVLRLVERMQHGHAHGREVRFVAGPIRGNLRLLAGMVRANRPWELVTRLSRALVAALGGAAFAIVSTGVWKVAAGAGTLRLLLLALASVLVVCASLIIAHDLWETSPGPAARARVVLLNLAAVITVVLGVLTMFLALLVVNAACIGLLIPSDVLADELGRPVDIGDYLQLAWLVSSLATIGGALGVVIESDLAVREAVYGYRTERSHDE